MGLFRNHIHIIQRTEEVHFPAKEESILFIYQNKAIITKFEGLSVVLVTEDFLNQSKCFKHVRGMENFMGGLIEWPKEGFGISTECF